MNGFDNTYPRKMRKWRGVRDTAYDYSRWLMLCALISTFFLRAPSRRIKGLMKYPGVASALALPLFVEREVGDARGAQLRAAQTLCELVVRRALFLLSALLDADTSLGGKAALSKRIVCLDALVPGELMAGFPALVSLPVCSAPDFLSAVAEQLVPGAASLGKVSLPAVGGCFVACAPPCGAQTDAYRDVCLTLPTYELDLSPARGESPGAALLGCIRFIEQQTGETFDWDAFVSRLSSRGALDGAPNEPWAFASAQSAQTAEIVARESALYLMRLHGGADARYTRALERLHRTRQEACCAHISRSRDTRRRALLCYCAANPLSAAEREKYSRSAIFVAESAPHALTDAPADASAQGALNALAVGCLCHGALDTQTAVQTLIRDARAHNAELIILCTHSPCPALSSLAAALSRAAAECGLEFVSVNKRQ